MKWVTSEKQSNERFFLFIIFKDNILDWNRSNTFNESNLCARVGVYMPNNF